MIDRMMRLSLVIVSGWAALLCYWAFFDDPIVITTYEQHVIDPAKPIHPGDTINLVVHFCQSRGAVANSGVRTIENEYTQILANQFTTTEPGCFTRHWELVVSPATVPGVHRYRFHAEYRINPVVTRTVSVPDFVFNVVPGPPSGGTAGAGTSVPPDGR